ELYTLSLHAALLIFAIDVCCSRGEPMSFGPKAGRHGQRINLLLLPPGTLIALPVKFTVVQSANGNGEPVADFSSHPALLSEPDVVGIGRRAAAETAPLTRPQSQMVAVWFRYRHSH